MAFEDVAPGATSAIEDLSYGAFSKRIWQRAAGQRIPLMATLELSRRCSLNCEHCYNNLPMRDPVARDGEMSVEDYRRLLDQMAEAGTLWVLFTGGEIFARSDFLEIYDYAKKKGFLITLFTNATLVTERVADHLANNRPFAMEVTLYGATKETYERVTRIPGSFQRCLDGVDRLVARKLLSALKTVVTEHTKDEVQAMAKMAAAWGCKFKFDGLINSRIDDLNGPVETRVDPHDIVQLDIDDPNRAKQWREFAEERMGKAAPESSDNESLYACGGGAQSFAIDPYGGMSICTFSMQDRYDVLSGSFREGWDYFLDEIRRRRRTRRSKCSSCQLRSICGSCPATNEIEAGDPEEPVDFFCRVAHLRAYRLGFDFLPHGDCEYCRGGSKHDQLMAHAAEHFGPAQETRSSSGGSSDEIDGGAKRG